MHWQPIETAPRDGTTILVWRKYEYSYDHLRMGLDRYVDGIWRFSRRDMQPTHWMPLPDPPTETK